MTSKLNWKKIKTDLNYYAQVGRTNLDAAKSEVQRLSQEIKGFNLKLSPTTLRKLKGLEKKYFGVLQSLNTAQRQADREIVRVSRKFKSQRADIEKALINLKEMAQKQREKIKAAADNFQGKTKPTKKASAKKTVKKATAAVKKKATRAKKKVASSL